jgi:hypothetical protein
MEYSQKVIFVEEKSSPFNIYLLYLNNNNNNNNNNVGYRQKHNFK